jgi:SAM-dependent methyltransferase
MTTPVIFDRDLLRRRRTRAIRHGLVDDALLPRVAGDLADRLSLVLRDFAVGLDLGTPGAELAEALALRGNPAQLYRLSESLAEGSRRPDLAGDGEQLPFAPESLNLVVSALALHWVNDLPGTLVQIRRALKPDGLFLAAMVGGESLTELRQAFAIAEAEILGGISPRVAPFADVRDLGGLLQRAGFTLPVADVDRLTFRYRDLSGLFRDLRAAGATNVLTERLRRPVSRRLLARVVEIYGQRFADQDGRLRATIDLVWLSGWAPHDSQQKPLAPGSARMRLADALGTREIGTGEKPGS